MRQHPDACYYDTADPYSSYNATRIELKIKEIYPETKYDDFELPTVSLYRLLNSINNLIT
jgi:hypothetical protein